MKTKTKLKRKNKPKRKSHCIIAQITLQLRHIGTYLNGTRQLEDVFVVYLKGRVELGDTGTCAPIFVLCISDLTTR